jgi:4-amino-4-deoxy-L-arabinose transferase-like glycosyltransferase
MANALVRLPASVVWSIGLGFLARLALAFFTAGTEDIITWAAHLESVTAVGIAQSYVENWAWNHPPLVGFCLQVINAAVSPDWHPFFFRLPASIADVGSAVLVYLLLARFADEERARSSAILVMLSPILIPISGFQGNTDPVFVFLILLSAWCLLVPRWVFVAGICFGLALNVKIVPIIVAPALFCWLRGRKDRAVLASTTAAVVLVGYLPTFVEVPRDMWRNMVQYSSYSGFWGFSLLGKWTGTWNTTWTAVFKWMSLLAAVGVQVWITRPDSEKRAVPLRLLAGIGSGFATFLALTPGFGPQYLAWLIPVAFVDKRAFAWLNATAGLYLFALYTYWCGGLPWYYGNPTRHTPVNDVLSLIPWITAFACIRSEAGELVFFPSLFRPKSRRAR